MATEEMNAINSVEEAADALDEALAVECEELEALDGAEKTSDKLSRKYAEIKTACTDAAKKGLDAAKAGTIIACLYGVILYAK